MKITKTTAVAAALIICALAAAWFHGGIHPKKTAPPGLATVGETEGAGSGENASPAGGEMLQDGAVPGLEDPPGAAAGPAGMPAEPPAGTEIQKPPQGGGASGDPPGLAEAEPRTDREEENTAPPEAELTCRLAVICTDILANMDRFNPDKREVLPADGIIYPLQPTVFYDGESVFDLLQREMKKHKIHLEYTAVPLYNSNYIEGINNIYEFDCGELSGWTYLVNGQSPGLGCSRCRLQEGDEIQWIYACDRQRN